MAGTSSNTQYVNPEDVEDRIPDLTINSSSDPTETEVEGIILDHEATIEAIVEGNGVNTPISQADSPKSWKYLKKWVLELAAAETWGRWVSNAGTGETTEREETLRDNAQEYKDDFIDNPNILSDASQDDGGSSGGFMFNVHETEGRT